MDQDLVTSLSNLNEEDALRITRNRLETGEDPLSILEDSRKGMEVVGRLFAEGEYFLPELIYSGEILNTIAEIVKPKIRSAYRVQRLGKVVLGTVAGDIHDIGLNIVEFILDINGFEVINLGVDVPAAKFVESIDNSKAGIVGLSGLLTLVYDAMRETVEAIQSAGLRDQVKIMIGGGQIDEKVRLYVGADAYGRDAMAAVKFAKQWTGCE